MTSPVRHAPRVFSIPPGEPFLRVLVDRLLDGTLVPGFPDAADPLSLARATILLPTRRACRALEEVFLERAGPALLLPRIRPIGEVDEDAFAFEPEDEGDAEPAADLPPVIKPLRRRVELTRLVLGWARALQAKGHEVLVPASPADASHLAGELARLMDTMATEGRPWSGLAAILPEDLQVHWQITLDFLGIATGPWVDFLTENGLVEPAERRRLLLEAEAARLSRLPPEPVIAAGSTGSIPATAHLLSTIARLPRGAVVLPGLDRDLDPAAWDRLLRADDGPDPAPSHPQSTLRHLIHGFDRLERSEIPHLGQDPGAEDPVLRARERLLSEVMRPAETTDAWAHGALDRTALARGLDGVALLEAQNETEEALAIALALRETLEMPGRTAALVTPDRTLARRVAAELTRFGVEIDDTSGRPLSETPAGVFARLVAEVARDRFEPVGVLALLQHPLTRLGWDAATVRRAARALERWALRGPRPAPGIAGLRAAMAVETPGTRAADKLPREDRGLAQELVERLAAAMEALETAAAGGLAGADRFFEAHATALDAIAAREDGRPSFSRDDDGRALALFLDELADAELSRLTIPPADYADLFASLMGGRTVRRTTPSDTRLRIYGLLEARLVRHDRVVLAGLVEGVWPAGTRTDPWLSRAMRADLALPAPERRIGLSAHDFVQAMGTRDVLLTRVQKRGGAPTVPSRWLQRLQAVLGADAIETLRRRAEGYLRLARAIDDAPGAPRPVAQPGPRPPLAARPRRLSVTEIETLVRDPYSIYAKRVLKLRPWEAVAEDVSASEKGTLIHDVFATYAKAVNAGGRRDVATLLALGRTAFAEVPRELAAFWWPRFERMAHWFVAFDAARREAGSRIVVEATGRLVLDGLPGGNFTLDGRADRLEQTLDGRLAVIDFKTGQPPSKQQVVAGLAPQLPLEAAMVANGAFVEHGLAAELEPADLLYIHLTGGSPPAKTRAITAKDGQTVADFAAHTLAELRTLLARFDDPATPYLSLATSRWKLRYGDYDHLARVREWGVSSEGGGE